MLHGHLKKKKPQTPESDAIVFLQREVRLLRIMSGKVAGVPAIPFLSDSIFHIAWWGTSGMTSEAEQKAVLEEENNKLQGA